jgi:hypothetical protein
MYRFCPRRRIAQNCVSEGSCRCSVQCPLRRTAGLISCTDLLASMNCMVARNHRCIIPQFMDEDLRGLSVSQCYAFSTTVMIPPIYIGSDEDCGTPLNSALPNAFNRSSGEVRQLPTRPGQPWPADGYADATHYEASVFIFSEIPGLTAS